MSYKVPIYCKHSLLSQFKNPMRKWMDQCIHCRLMWEKGPEVAPPLEIGFMDFEGIVKEMQSEAEEAKKA